jgi:hypothetical protein
VSYDDYDLNTVRLVLDLASAGEGTLTLGQLTERQRRMFEEHGYRAGEGMEASLTRLGARLAAVLGEPSDDAFLDALAGLLERQDCKPHLTRHDGVPHLHFARDDAPFGEWVAAMAVSGLVLYVCRDGRSRLRRCAATGCGKWFADTSRNQSRRYCEAACASRTTVAAFRARRRGQADTPAQPNQSAR